MELRSDLKEISAEMLLNYLYPELEDKWVARHEGTFYRNYNDDTLAVDPETAEVTLARDGFLKLLPQGVITREEELKGKEVKGKYEAMKKRNHLLMEAFLPIDSFNFRKKLRIERTVSELLEDKMDFILSRYYGVEVDENTDPYIREAAYILPYVSKKRGDFVFIRELMKSVLGCPVKMSRGRFSGTDTTVSWLPMVRYDLLVDGLDVEEYGRMAAEIKPFCNFLLEWFIPVDTVCRFAIRQKSGDGVEGGKMILDYNIELD
ncbi:MAG: hypothetical protein Q4F39_02115 [Bacteroidia bacterium]|nr:hypothetical protein [Bacteroidia bacterium]